MRTWALVPVKCFDRGKSRLASVLAADERERFARALFDHVMTVLAGAAILDGVLVATDCDAVASAARAHGASVRLDAAPACLSSVIDAGLADVATRGADRAIVLMADLPRLSVEDLSEMARALDGRDVVIVADREGRHTNALALAPPDAMPTRFGSDDSFAEHCAVARAAGLRLAVLDNARIAFDVDGPADHASL